MNKIFVGLILFLCLFAASTIAQQFPSDVKENLNISILPEYQSWQIENGADLSQVSSSFDVNYYFLRYTRLTLSGRFASTDGDVEKLSGFSDSQVALSHKFEKINLVLDAGINLPSGKANLNEKEFLTSRLISQDVFNMRVGNYGQGLNIYFGGLFAFAAGDNVSLGFGASYQARGEYEPFKDDSSTYKPSDEILITAGADFSMNNSNTLSFDLTAMFYGSDKINDKELFDSGDRILFTGLYTQYFGLNALHVLAGYRHRMLSSFNEDYLLVEDEKVNPDNIFAMINYVQNLSKSFSIGFSLKGNFYEATSAEFSGYNVFEYGLNPLINISSNVQLPINFKFLSGSTEDKPNLLGYEASIGLRFIY